MIRALRQRHRQIITTLGIILPIAVVAGIAARKPMPAADSLSFDPVLTQSSFRSVLWDNAELWPQKTFQTRLFTNDELKKRYAVEITPRHDIVEPDLLVYWTASLAKMEELPEHAVLLGVFGQRLPAALPLPEEFGTTRGALILYSLAGHKVVATSKPFGVAMP